MHEFLCLAEAHAGRAPPNRQSKPIDEIGPRMRKGDSLSGIGGTSSLAFHDGVGEFIVILHMPVVTKQLRYFDNAFRRRAFAQFEDDQPWIKNFREQSGHARIAERLIGLTG